MDFDEAPKLPRKPLALKALRNKQVVQVTLVSHRDHPNELTISFSDKIREIVS